MIPLGKRIRELRLQKDWSQEVLAKGICEPGMISQIETGRANPSPATLRLIAEKLEVTLHELTENAELGLADKNKFAIAKTLLNSGQPASAIPLLKELADSPNLEVPIQQVRLTLAICYTGADQHDDALDLLRRLEESALFADDRELMTSISFVRSQVFMVQQQHSVSLYHLQQALSHYKQLTVKNPHLYTQIMLGIADVYLAEGQHDLALKVYNNLLKHQLEFLQLQQKADIHLNLASEYERSGDLQTAYEQITHANHLYETLQDMENYEYCRCKMLALSTHEYNWRERVEDLREMAFGYENVANHRRAGEVFVDVAAICLHFAEYEEAEIAAQDALGQFRQQSGDHPAKGNAHRYLAAYYFHQQSLDEGKEHLKQAVAVFQKHHLLAELDETITFLCTHLKEEGRVEEAYEHLMAHKAYLLDRLKVRRQLQEFGEQDDLHSETSSH